MVITDGGGGIGGSVGVSGYGSSNGDGVIVFIIRLVVILGLSFWFSGLYVGILVRKVFGGGFFWVYVKY